MRDGAGFEARRADQMGLNQLWRERLGEVMAYNAVLALIDSWEALEKGEPLPKLKGERADGR
jgi:hypothetical protein